MVDITALKRTNASRWREMHLKADRIGSFDATAKRLCAPTAKAMYRRLSDATGVPWFVIAVIHEREAGGPPHWDRHLGQGDPLARKTVHEPKGRGPFLGNDAFYRGGLDALIDCPPHASKWTDWTAGGALTLLEEYNGTGYAARGVPSAYVWSGTDQYVSGKYVADHDYRANVVDVQEGCAPIIARMAAIDASVKFSDSAVAPLPPLPPPPDIEPPPAPNVERPEPTPPSGLRFILGLIAAIFRKRT